MKFILTTLLLMFSVIVFAQKQEQINEHLYTIKVKENNANVQSLVKDLKSRKGVENLKFNESKKEISFVMGLENTKGDEKKSILSLVKKNDVIYDDFDIKSSHNSSRSIVSKKK